MSSPLAPSRSRSAALVVAFVALAGALTAAATSAGAQSRPSSVRMTCEQVRALVAARGAVVLGTGGDTFDRFVVHRGFCPPTDIIKPAWVPTRDVPQCMVGYRCVDPGPYLPW